MKIKFGDRVIWEGFEAIVVLIMKDRNSSEGIAQILIEAPLFKPRERRTIFAKNREGFSHIENVVLLSSLKKIRDGG